MKLESRIHEIIVHAIRENSRIESRVTGVLEGIRIPVGNVSCDDHNAILKVGPHDQ